MNLLLLTSLLLAEPPLWTGPPCPPTPATVVASRPVASVDFAPPLGAAGMTLPGTGAAVVDDGGNPVLRLTPGYAPATVWLTIPPEARGRYLRLTGRVRAEEGSGALSLGAVEGTRPANLAPAWARDKLVVTDAWQAFTWIRRLPPAADMLAFGADAEGRPVRLDDLKLVSETRVEDQRLAAMAERRGNRIPNGGFEAGAEPFKAVVIHPSMTREDPPLPTALRVGDRGAFEGKNSVQTFVGDGELVITAPLVVLPPGSTWTFSLSARAHAREGGGRVRLQLAGSDGSAAGPKEVALGGDWTRLATTVTTPAAGGPTVWRPELHAFPGDSPYGLELDALALLPGATAIYAPAGDPYLQLDDGLGEALGLGHVASPDEPVSVAARLTAGDDKLTGVIKSELESHLGALVTKLPDIQVAAEPHVTVEAALPVGKLPPGWYRLRVRVEQEGRRVASAERIFAALFDPAKDDWKLALRWTTPDVLLRGRSRSELLGRLAGWGVGARWLAGNPAALWATIAPRPGELRTSAVLATIDADREANLATILEVDPYPRREDAPDWLAAEAPRAPEGRLLPSPAALDSYVSGLAKALTRKPLAWAVTPPPTADAKYAALAAQADRVLRAADPGADVLAPGAWQRLPAVESGPLESDWVTLAQAGEDADPYAAQAADAASLLTAAAAGHRALLWPNQGLLPALWGEAHGAGLTNPDGGPKPFVAVWFALRELVGTRPLLGSMSRDGRHVAVFGDQDRVLAVWADAPAQVPVKLPKAEAVLATGEPVRLPEGGEGVTLGLSPWPLYLTGLTPEAADLVAAAVAGPAGH